MLPIIGVSGLLGLVALVDKLNRNEITVLKDPQRCHRTLPPPRCSQIQTSIEDLAPVTHTSTPANSDTPQANGDEPAQRPEQPRR